MPEDSIKRIVDEIESKGYSSLEDFIARKESEQFFVDFKLTENKDYKGKKTLYNSDRKNLAKAISGFGNSEGGVIIWGIDAHKDTDGNDYAKAIVPIESPENFKSLIESFIGIVTVPPHRKVRNIVVKKNQTDEEGVVVTIIPKSDNRPHQNINDKDFKYYMRAGDSFLPIPHGVLQGMFGQEPLPNIIMIFHTKTPTIQQDTINWEIGIAGVNRGLGIATDIYGHARAWVPGNNCEFGIFPYDMQNYNYQKAYGIEFSFISKPDYRLGHEQRTQMVTMTFKLKPPFDRDMEIELLLGSRNQAVVQKSLKRTKEELQKIYDKYIGLPPSMDFVEAVWDADVINKQ